MTSQLIVLSTCIVALFTLSNIEPQSCHPSSVLSHPLSAQSGWGSWYNSGRDHVHTKRGNQSALANIVGSIVGKYMNCVLKFHEEKRQKS